MFVTVEQWMLFALTMLFVKHWYVDFVNQTMAEVESKAQYLSPRGLWHSAKHGIGTGLVFLLSGIGLVGALLLATIDFLLHYHIDWTKMNYGNRDITNPQFWNHLGLDQLAHSLTYLGLVYVVILFF